MPPASIPRPPDPVQQTTLPRRRWLGWMLAVPGTALLGACASLAQREPVRVNVVGIEPLPAEGLELRFAVRLRVINPNDAPVVYDGTFVQMDVGDRLLASGVSDARGQVPRFGESVLTVPVSISGLSLLRQLLAVQRQPGDPLDVQLSGRLQGPGWSAVRFSERGQVGLPTDWTRILR